MVTELRNIENTPLSYPLVLVDETVIGTLGESAAYIATLPAVCREWTHWKLALQALTRATYDASYLQAATICLQTALILDASLSRPHPADLY